MLALFARRCAVLVLFALCQCSHVSHPGPVASGSATKGVPLTAAAQTAFRERMAKAQVPLTQVALTAKANRFGPEGRARVTLQLVLQRPNLFRVTVLGPHGPPLLAAACDGAQLTSLDVANKVFRTQPATAAGIARHLGGIELGLTAEDWLHVLFGEMDVPESAVAHEVTARNGARAIVWRWNSHGRTIAAEFDVNECRLRRATITLGDGRLGTLSINGHGPSGLPEQLNMHLGQSPGGKEASQDLELTLADEQALPSALPQETFVLQVPGAVPSLSH